MKPYLKINKFKAPFDISWLFKKDILKMTKILTSKGANVYVVGGSVRNSYWKEETFDLSFLNGHDDVRIRFFLDSDFGGNHYGWLLDDISIKTTKTLKPYIAM